MDTISGHINFESPPQPHSSPRDVHILTSVNQLRSFSTALSAFITALDDFHSHINFIDSSIDSMLPRHLLETNLTTTLLEFDYEQTIITGVNVSSAQNIKETDTCEALKKHTHTDALKKDELTVVETSCHNQTNTITLVLEDIVSQQNPNGIATITPENAECLRYFEETDAFDQSVPETSCHDQTTTVVVSEQNPKGMVTGCEQRYETTQMTENAEFSQDYGGSDALKKHEETVAESLCERTITDVPEAVVSEQNDNGLAANGEQRFEHVRISESLDVLNKIDVIDVCKQPEQTDILNKHEEIDVCKNLEGTVVLKEPEGLDSLMIPEETVPSTLCDQTITAVAEAIVSEQNPNGMDGNGERSRENVRIPDSLDEINVLKKPEETVSGTSCDQTTPAVPEAIVSKQIHNRMATTREKSHQNVSKKRAVIDRTPEQTDILKKPKQTDIDTSKKREVTVVLKKHEDIDISKNRKEVDTLKKREKTGTCKKAKETIASKKSVISALEYMCQSMNSKDMKRHVAAHFSEMIDLRKEIAKALKLAEDPAKLVLNSIGRFYVQGRRTFCKGSGSHQDEQNRGRMAAVLILECFVMISNDGGIEIAKRDKECAAQAAVDWRNRMIREGRLRHADEVDARGLLLLISGFGIQDRVFKIQDILDLIRASNWKGISAALRHSVILVPKIPDVIDLMVKNNLHIEAADIVYTFGLEDECHPRSILASFLRKYIRNIQKGSYFQTLEEKKQQLLDLKAVKQCLESHNIDPLMYLPDFKINKEIQNLEKELNNAKLTQKRKSLENPIHQEAKRACFGHEKRPHHQSPIDHHGKNRCYRSTRSSIGYFDSDRDLHNSYITNYLPSAAYNTHVARETVTSPVPNGRASGFPGLYDHVRHSADAQPYGWHEPYVQHYSRHGQTYDCIRRRGPSSALYGFADIVERETRWFHA